ncbi:MAG: hypothetical protein ACE5FD_01885 [Anaerolineae bacterium]
MDNKNNIPTAQAPTEAIRQLVQAGRQKFNDNFGHSQQQFEELRWEVGQLQHRMTNSVSIGLYFTRHGSTDEGLPAAYADVVKSWVLLAKPQLTTGHMRKNVRAARVLWEALRQRCDRNEIAFNWSTLCEEDLNQAELFMQAQGWSSSTICDCCLQLVHLGEFLASRKICRPLYYTIQTPRPGQTVHTAAGQAQRRTKLPSPNALAGLARVYSQLATEPAERLLAAAAGLLMVTGFRIGELLTLSEDCEVNETNAGQSVYGLRYYREKTPGGEKDLAIRWLTPLQAELAQEAIAEIRNLTADARVRARELEQDPDRFPLPLPPSCERIRVTQLRQMMGEGNKLYLPTAEVPRYRGSGYHYYCLTADVEAYLFKKRVKRLWTVDKRDGTYQMLSETLFIAFRNFLHKGRAANRLLVQPITAGQFNNFLNGEQSVFERYDIRDVDGQVCGITSHQFRHWLNDLADKGGLPNDVLTRWMGRKNPRHTQAYRHATMDERLQWVKQGIQDNELGGFVAEVYQELPLAERDEFLEGQVQAVHFTPMGICIHDFAIEPCPYHLTCLRGCPDYLRTKGDPIERQYLLQIQANTEKALAWARQESAPGKTNMAQAWLDHHEAILSGVQAALAVDDETTIPDGTRTQPNGKQIPLPVISKGGYTNGKTK